MKKILIGIIAALALIGCNGTDKETIIVTEGTPQAIQTAFDGLNVAYDSSDLNCSGGEIHLTMTYKTDENIDPFSFLLEHSLNDLPIDFSNVNVDDTSAVTRVTDTITIDEPGEHGLAVVYYGEEVILLSNHLFVLGECEDG